MAGTQPSGEREYGLNRARPRTMGWYTDPRGTDDTYRWWDGRGWTDWLSADPDAPPPSRPPRQRIEPDPARARQRRRRWLLALAALGTVLVLLAAATAWGMARNAARPDGVVTPSDFGTPEGEAEVPLLDVDANRFAVKGRWACLNAFYDAEPVEELPGVFSALATSGGSDYADTVAAFQYVAVLDPALAGGDDSQALALAATQRLQDLFYDQAPTAVRGEPASEPWPDRGNATMVRVTTTDPAGRPEPTSDEIQVMVEVWPDGTRVMWASVIRAAGPVDTEDETAAVDSARSRLEESLGSIG